MGRIVTNKEFALILSPTLLKNLILVGCAILLKETVKPNKLKNALCLLLENEQTLPNSYYRRLTRFFDGELAQRHLWKGLMRWLHKVAQTVPDYLIFKKHYEYRYKGWGGADFDPILSYYIQEVNYPACGRDMAMVNN